MIPPSNENNSLIILIQKMKLLLLNENDVLSERVVAVRELVSFLENIMRSAVTSDVFFYFLEHGAATAWVLQVDLDQPEASVYRALRRLRRMDVIVDAIRLSRKVPRRRRTKGGPRTTVWAIRGADAVQVSDAIRKHHRALSPKYRAAELSVQTVIKDYLGRKAEPESITYTEILELLRGEVAPFRAGDVAELAATILHEQGIRVWR